MIDTSYAQASLAPSTETGKLGIMHLKRYWQKAMLKRQNQLYNELKDEWQIDKTLLFALNLGLDQTLVYLYHNMPTFEAFEDWIIDTGGVPIPDNVLRFNKLFTDTENHKEDSVPDFLTPQQLDFWNENGYVIIKNAVPKEDCENTISLMCDFMGIDRNDPQTWYEPHAAKQGIWVQLYQHPQLQKNRESENIRMGFEQLWGRTDIWATTDRVGFNPPETATWKFPGPDLHWDSSLSLPMRFGLQGILYLADTAPEQGAFTVVPGFQNRLENWLNSLPEGANPREQNLHALGSKPIAAEAGDFIIWHHALPHGSSPNRFTKPRFVQYITYTPADEKESAVWI